MLRITEAQMEALSRQQAANFAQRVVNFLKQNLPEYRNAPNDQTYAVVKQLLGQATQYGFESEREFIVFVLAAHYLGGGFDTAIASVRATLSDSSRTAAWKADWLEAMSLMIEGKRERGEL